MVTILNAWLPLKDTNPSYLVVTEKRTCDQVVVTNLRILGVNSIKSPPSSSSLLNSEVEHPSQTAQSSPPSGPRTIYSTHATIYALYNTSSVGEKELNPYE